MSAQFIFTMRKVSRFHPPDKEVLKDISLSFFPGAKIGVLGANGAGKSSLLRVMLAVPCCPRVSGPLPPSPGAMRDVSCVIARIHHNAPLRM